MCQNEAQIKSKTRLIDFRRCLPSMPVSQMARSSCMGTRVASWRTASHWSYWKTSARPGPWRCASGLRGLLGLSKGASNFSPNHACRGRGKQGEREAEQLNSAWKIKLKYKIQKERLQCQVVWGWQSWYDLRNLCVWWWIRNAVDQPRLLWLPTYWDICLIWSALPLSQSFNRAIFKGISHH